MTRIDFIIIQDVQGICKWVGVKLWKKVWVSAQQKAFDISSQIPYNRKNLGSCGSDVRRSALGLKKGMGCKSPHETVL